MLRAKWGGERPADADISVEDVVPLVEEAAKVVVDRGYSIIEVVGFPCKVADALHDDGFSEVGGKGRKGRREDGEGFVNLLDVAVVDVNGERRRVVVVHGSVVLVVGFRGRKALDPLQRQTPQRRRDRRKLMESGECGWAGRARQESEMPEG